MANKAVTCVVRGTHEGRRVNWSLAHAKKRSPF